MISRFLLWIHRLGVRRIRTNGTGDVSRVEWEIGGNHLWFESKDCRLSGEPEAIACICFAAASLADWKVRFRFPVCRVLAGNLKSLSKIWHRWWGGKPKRFRTKVRSDDPIASPERGTAVFLSLGVDSFHTLLNLPGIEHIVYVAGYDVKLADVSRLERIEKSLRTVGDARGMKVTFVRTNLREHPVFAALPWERFHGAALAAVGHLLAESVHKIVISSTYPRQFFRPWGSSWKTDHRWSSSILEVAHFGEDLWRFEKLERIADDPMLRAHLRICWEHRNEELNCGRCEKCMRTMLGLLLIGKLQFYPTFPDETALLSRLRGIKSIPEYLIPTYQGFIKRGLPPDAVKVVRQLIRRSNPAKNHGLDP